MKTFLLLIFSCFLSTNYSQTPNILWSRFYNNWYNYAEIFGCTVDNSNGFYTVGTTINNNSSNNRDILVLKLNSATGDTIWSAVFNSSSNKDDEATRCVVDNAGNLYVVGYADVGTSSNTNDDLVILKYNTANGNLIWSKTYNHVGTSPFSDEMGMDCTLDETGNLYVTGWTFFNNKTETLTIKLNTSNQQIVWVKTFSSAPNIDDNGGGIVYAKTNFLYVGGYSFNGTTYNLVTIKYNLNGDTIWTRKSENTIDSLEAPIVGINIDGNENVFISGNGGIKKNLPNRNAYGQTIKYNSSGIFQWKSIIDGATEYDALFDNVVDKNGNVYCVGVNFPGNHEDDYAIYKLNGNNGSVIWSASYNGQLNKADFAIGCALDSDGNLYVSGTSAWGVRPGSGGLIFKYKSTVTDLEEINSIVNNFQLLQNYPNPFNPKTNIKYLITNRDFVTLKVYDVLGNEVATLVDEMKEAGNYEVEFTVDNLSSGVYFTKLATSNFIKTIKMVLKK